MILWVSLGGHASSPTPLTPVPRAHYVRF
eukprot:COSAG02_NODE_12148_length_1589_cov_1.789933_1_plen_28_part_10